ncbi:MAG: TraR/DksA family transcriptional regulator [Candidatus Aminicenantes bacterium]|nr:TraR/DksA family transcriptional regulator [Candidatus Aminicenantes bacterium]
MTKKMTKKERLEYERQLQERKEKIIRKLSELSSQSLEVEASNVAQDVVDKAESSYTKEFLLSLSDAEREQLLLIDDALRRLARDEFGFCQLCRKEIGKKRMAALPWTPYCIDCQEKAEEESRGQ